MPEGLRDWKQHKKKSECRVWGWQKVSETRLLMLRYVTKNVEIGKKFVWIGKKVSQTEKLNLKKY